MTQFKYNSVKIQDLSINCLAPINSAQGNFSTSQSTFSKNNIKNMLEGHSSNLDECMNEKISQIKPLIQKQQTHNNRSRQQQSNRLFTFMDEKQCQKRVIYNFINKHKMSHNQQSSAYFKEKQNVPIVTMIQQSRQKRQQFLKKIMNLNTNKSNKEIKKNDRNIKIKLHKNSYLLQLTPSNLKSRSKTPKQQPYRSITPKYDKIIRVKSSLQKDFISNGQNKRQLLTKVSKKVLQPRKSNNRQTLTIFYDDNKENKNDRSVKALIKQKRQLQKKLSQINESLININKGKVGKKNPIKITSKANCKKSKAKLFNL